MSDISWLRRYSRIVGEKMKTTTASKPRIPPETVVIILGPTRSEPIPAINAPTGKSPDHKLAIPEHLKARYEKAMGRKLVFGIRPEDIHDSRLKEPFPDAERIPGTVKVVEPIGAHVILLCSIGSTTITAAVDPQTEAKLHAPIEFLFDMNKMHLFDRETEEAY